MLIATAEAFALAPAVNPTPLWKIEKDGRVSYLLGSLHRGIGASDLPEVVQAVIASSAKIYFESDFAKAADLFRTTLALPATGPSHPPSRLSLLLSVKAWDKFKTELASRLTDAELESLTLTQTAWILGAVRDARMAKVPRVAELAVQVPGGMLDMELYLKAKQIHPERMGFLEGAEVAQRFFQSLQVSAADLEADLMLTDNEVEEKTLSALRRLISAGASYRTGDLHAALRHLGEISENAETNASLTAEFLSQRNLAWLPLLEAGHRSGPAVFVVGLAHILGKDNLIGLLQSRGYRIRRVLTNGDCDSLLAAGKAVAY